MGQPERSTQVTGFSAGMDEISRAARSTSSTFCFRHDDMPLSGGLWHVHHTMEGTVINGDGDSPQDNIPSGHTSRDSWGSIFHM